MSALLALTPLAAAPTPPAPEPAIRLMLVLLGVLVATLVAILVLVALRRSLRRPAQRSGHGADAPAAESPWAIAGKRVAPVQEPPESEGGPSLDVPGDADPNDDTWQGPAQ